MIHLYYPDNTNYEANGDVILMPYKCEATAGINRTWQIDLEHPIDNEGRWKAIKTDAVIKCPSFNGTQLWRIVQTEKNDGGVTATCDPIFYDAVHEVIFVDRITLNNMTAQQMLDRLTEGTKFSGVSHIAGTQSAWFQTENLVEAITGNEHGLVKTFYDAEVGFDNYTVILEDELGGDYGASVVYGKNLAVDGISESVNIDGTITRIIPVAYNGHTLPELYVDSQYIDDYPFPRIGFIQYDNLRLWSEREEGEEGDSTTEYFNSLEELYAAMRAAAQLEYTDNEIDKPQVSMEVEMVLIQNTEEYKDYKDLEKVSIGDYVRCYNPRLGIDSKTRVRTLVYDCIRESVISVELGHEKRNYFDNVTSMIDRVESAITPGGTVVAEKIAGLINGAYAQLRLQNTIAKKQDVRAILFEDLDPDSPTFGALAIGTQGWQISRERTADDRDWVWTTAATSEGIIANVVVTGLLSDKLGRNYWNLDNGNFRLTGATITDADIDGYATDSELGTVDTKATNAGTAASNAQTTANTAVTNAATAQTTANNAQTAAATADGKAVAAQATANTANSNAQAAQGTANTAITNAAAAQSTADGNTQKLKAMYGTCTTAAGTAAKVVNATDFVLYSGATINVLMSNTNSAANPTLNVNGTGARPIYAYGSAITSTSNYWWTAGQLVQFTYNGSQWLMQVDNQTATFNKLTQGGTKQGITMDSNGNLYINASYINSGTMSADRISGGTISGVTISGNTITGGTISGTTISGSTISGNTISGGTISGTTISGSTITSYVTGTTKGVEIKNGAVEIYNGTNGSIQGYIRGARSTDSTTALMIGGVDASGLGDYQSNGAIKPMFYRIKSSDYTQIGTSKNYHISLSGSDGSTVIAGRNTSNALTTTRLTINGTNDYATMGGTWRLNGPLQVSDGGTWTSGTTGTLITDSINGLRARRYVRGILISDTAYTTSRAVTYSGFLAAGHITGSKTQLVFFIPSPVDLSNYSNATKNSTSPTSFYVRVADGTDDYKTISYSSGVSSVSATVASNGLYVTVNLRSALSVTNDDIPCSVALQGSIGFNLS